MRCARCGFDASDLWQVLPVVIARLQQEGRISYRVLKRGLDCDDALLEDLCAELVFKRLATDEDGKGLVWIGGDRPVAEPPSPRPAPDAHAAHPRSEGSLPSPLAPAPPDGASPVTEETADSPAAAETDPAEAQASGPPQDATQDAAPGGTQTQHPPILLGRDVEVGLCELRREQSKEGFGQVVLVSGAAGIGKSQLVSWLSRAAQQDGATCLSFRCQSDRQLSALWPVVEHLRQRLEWQAAENRLDRLETFLRVHNLSVDEMLPIFARLLSVSLDGRTGPQLVSPHLERRELYAGLTAWLLHEAQQTPVFMCWEDLHWADPSTLELIGLLIEQTSQVRMLNVCTFRSEFVVPWSNRSYMTPLSLDPLEDPDTEALIRRLADGAALPDELVHAITTTSAGVPLFAEALTKLALDSALLEPVDGHSVLHAPLAELKLPTTLAHTLAARLERLPQAQEAVQLGAVLGPTFSYETLRSVLSTDERRLQEQCAQLVRSGLIVQHGPIPRACYRFAHDVIHQVAYTSTPPTTRQKYHHHYGTFLTQHCSELAQAQPECVARHYAEAETNEPAVAYWLQAGQRAYGRAAYREAAEHLQHGLAVVPSLPDAAARYQTEFALQAWLGRVLAAGQNLNAPEVEQAYGRAHELSARLADDRTLSPLLFSVRQFYAARADYRSARELAQRQLTLAEQAGERALRLTAHVGLGTVCLWLGEYATALEHFEQSIALYQANKHRTLALRYGTNPKTTACSLAAWTVWYLGYPEQALSLNKQARSVAQDAASPLELTWAALCSAWLHQHRGEWQLVHEPAAQGLSLAAEHGLSFPSAVAGVLQGWALAKQGQTKDGIEQVHRGLSLAQDSGVGWGRPYLLGLLADAYGLAGQAEEGLNVLVDALGIIRRTDERFCEPELYRLRGELLLAREHGLSRPQASSSEAEDCLLLAIKIARRQSAKSWELRAALSLSRLWQRQGKTQQAHQVLESVYGWFSEGLDTPDAQDARALLAALG